MKQVTIIFTLILIMNQSTIGQQDINKNPEKPILHSSIKVIAKSYGDSVVLRWAPANAWAWHKLNYMGYKIERIDLSEKDNAKKEILTILPLKPYSLEKFKTVFKPGNNNAAIAAQCLYGKNFETNLRQGQAAIEDRASVSDARFTYTLMVADYDANVGVATALRFTDKNVKKGAKYIYRIMPAVIASQGTIDTGTVMVINNRMAATGKPEITEGLAFDHLSELHWNRNGAETWSGFYVERSEDGQTFNALNTLPFISSAPDSAVLKKDSSKAKLFSILHTQHIYIDSLPHNYKTYVYRIRGVNAFAEISDYSNTVTLSGKDLTAPVAVNILNPVFISDRKMKVVWQKSNIEPDCKGYYITRASNINGPYETLNQQILSPTANEFTDNNAIVHGGSFYIVVAVDTANNISSSVPAMGIIPDNTPPAIPSGLKGNIEKNGLVHLSWTANKEEDIKGYKVYFANVADHVFTQITTEPDTAVHFVDSITLNTLTKNIWYKIVAVDYNNNHSDFSTAIRLKKPDIVPPAAPVATNIVVKSNAIAMDWIQSSSADAVGYIIYRGEEKQVPVAISTYKHSVSFVSFHFEDSTAKPNTAYIYTAKAIDEDSLYSPASLPIHAKINRNAERPALTSLKASYDTKEKNIHLAWQYNETGSYFFILSRSHGTEPFKPLRSLNKEENSFIDNTVQPGATYRYIIQAIWKDINGNTRMNDPVTVIVPATN